MKKAKRLDGFGFPTHGGGPDIVLDKELKLFMYDNKTGYLIPREGWKDIMREQYEKHGDDALFFYKADQDPNDDSGPKGVIIAYDPNDPETFKLFIYPLC